MRERAAVKGSQRLDCSRRIGRRIDTPTHTHTRMPAFAAGKIKQNLCELFVRCFGRQY